MNVLYLCHRIPYPLHKGEKIRAFHQLKALAREHEVDLFTLADDPADMQHRAVLLRHCREVTVEPVNASLNRLRALPWLLTKTPLTVPCFRSGALSKQVRSALARRSYDRVFVYSSSMAQYAADAAGIPLIVDFVDVDSNKWAQYAGFAPFPFSAVYRREAHCLRRLEREICDEASCVLVTTGREAELVRELSSGANVHVVANGVDAEQFSVSRTGPSAPVIIFVGDMSYFPNEEAVTRFTREVFPMVRRSVPEAKFLIVGRKPTAAVRRLGNTAGVEVTGFVPDVRRCLAEAAVAVAPFSIAAGVQNKVLEAMASGLPVVGTPRSVQGLIPRVAEAVEVGEMGAELGHKLVSLLRKPALARSKGLESRKRVVEEYDWERHLDALLQLVRDPRRRAAQSVGSVN